MNTISWHLLSTFKRSSNYGIIAGISLVKFSDSCLFTICKCTSFVFAQNCPNQLRIPVVQRRSIDQSKCVFPGHDVQAQCDWRINSNTKLNPVWVTAQDKTFNLLFSGTWNQILMFWEVLCCQPRLNLSCNNIFDSATYHCKIWIDIQSTWGPEEWLFATLNTSISRGQ